ncbi:SoxR reducing system RseC family protein [Halomonas denitrificans]|uniref:SoxR reducing system RseC family protein n=1 Tax=Halomonas denitrificans TaxID=370769 RepID=UPI001C99E341|nr:SoxR reducing system RseC family protein [Halomonas denitrificans]MBY5969428.1 SoxR reducing system RseC family protein [Halomonas denitrificans]
MSGSCATAEATVVGWTLDGIRVAVKPQPGCGQCAARGGCGARWLSQDTPERRELEVATTSRPPIGKPVTIRLASATLVRASVLMYGLPLWVALGLTLLVELAWPEHWSSPLAFVAGLVVGAALLRRHLQRQGAQFRPQLVGAPVDVSDEAAEVRSR